MQTAVCPECGKNVTVGPEPKMGKMVTCKNCGTDLEIVWLDPLELDWPLDEDEFDDDYEYEE